MKRLLICVAALMLPNAGHAADSAAQQAVNAAAFYMATAYSCPDDPDAYERAIKAAPDTLAAGGMTAAKASAWLVSARASIESEPPADVTSQLCTWLLGNIEAHLPETRAKLRAASTKESAR